MIYHSDNRIVTPEYAANFHLLLTDPPYSAYVHENATSQSKGGGTRERDLGFGYLTPAMRRHVAMCASQVQRWSVIYSDVESSTWLRISCEAQGAEYVRTVPWVRWSMPQLSGTMPAQGFEHVLVFHRQHLGKRGGRRPMGKVWTGPGDLVELPHECPIEELRHTCLRGDNKHKAEKPLDQALDLVSWFSQPGELVLDLFAGSGVFGLACALLGRQYVGFEADPEWALKGVAREATALTGLSDKDLDRIVRWIEAKDDSAMTPAALERKAKRDYDKTTVLAKVA